MKKLFIPYLTSLFAVLLFSSSGFAGGFRVSEQSASGLGMANAFVGMADDPSAVWYNPSGITQLDGTRVAGGVIGIYPTIMHDNTDGTTDVAERTVHLPVHFYATSKLNDRIWFGFGMNTPFGLSTNWDQKNSSTRYVSTFSSLALTNINPNIAYRFSDDLSAAVGIDYVRVIKATAEKILDLGSIGLGDQNFRFSGDGGGWGANAALLYQATKNLDLGLSYRSGVKVELDGTLEIAGGALAGDGHSELPLPAMAQFGASYKMSENLTLNADAEYNWWSAYDRIVLHSGTFAALGLPADQTEEKQWMNTWTIRIGLQYKLPDQWKLRAGCLYEQNAIKEEWFDNSVPDSDLLGIAFGAGYSIGNVTIDGGYMYLVGERTITNSLADDATPNPDALNGAYRTRTHIAGITIGYKF